MQIRFYLFQLYFILINSLLLHNRLENAIHINNIQFISSKIELNRNIGMDERHNENITENQYLLLSIIKNIERVRQIEYLESIKGFPYETKIQIVKDLEEEGDIRPFSMTNGGLFNNWLLDEEFDN
jgi:hypothetical protein